ncbi:four helix bundle protein [Bacteroidales bacterium 6E]|nr:four helix bundle protein [Bacteroidales bacterium 6E]
MNYRDLDIYKLSLELFFKVHPLSMMLPKHELFELGSQIRRSADSIVTNIVEGYGRRMYKAEYIRFLIYSHSSTDETLNHLQKIATLYPELREDMQNIEMEYNRLGSKINAYIKFVQTNWRT